MTFISESIQREAICFPGLLNADNEQINKEQSNYSECMIWGEIMGKEKRADMDRTSTLSVTIFVNSG